MNEHHGVKNENVSLSTNFKDFLFHFKIFGATVLMAFEITLMIFKFNWSIRTISKIILIFTNLGTLSTSVLFVPELV